MSELAVGPVVTAEWLDAHGDGVVMVDVRREHVERSAAEAFAEGHLPGAVLVSLEQWLSAPASFEAGRHPMPAPDVFAEGMCRAGVGDDDVVVAYDDAGGVIAARLVWMLRAIGHEAALLDGGMQPGGPQERGAPTSRQRAHFTARPWPASALADMDDALDPRHVVLDARPRDRFLGAPDPLDPRPGHIPNARSLPCRENLDERGFLLPTASLRRRFEEAGVTGRDDIVSYCGSGVTACHNLLVLEHVGLGRGRLYPGSWSQYANAPGRPAALDVDPANGEPR